MELTGFGVNKGRMRGVAERDALEQLDDAGGIATIRDGRDGHEQVELALERMLIRNPSKFLTSSNPGDSDDLCSSLTGTFS